VGFDDLSGTVSGTLSWAFAQITNGGLGGDANVKVNESFHKQNSIPALTGYFRLEPSGPLHPVGVIADKKSLGGLKEESTVKLQLMAMVCERNLFLPWCHLVESFLVFLFTGVIIDGSYFAGGCTRLFIADSGTLQITNITFTRFQGPSTFVLLSANGGIGLSS